LSMHESVPPTRLPARFSPPNPCCPTRSPVTWFAEMLSPTTLAGSNGRKSLVSTEGAPKSAGSRRSRCDDRDGFVDIGDVDNAAHGACEITIPPPLSMITSPATVSRRVGQSLAACDRDAADGREACVRPTTDGERALPAARRAAYARANNRIARLSVDVSLCAPRRASGTKNNCRHTASYHAQGSDSSVKAGRKSARCWKPRQKGPCWTFRSDSLGLGRPRCPKCQ